MHRGITLPYSSIESIELTARNTYSILALKSNATVSAQGALVAYYYVHCSPVKPQQVCILNNG
jgi:hypothetical protein